MFNAPVVSSSHSDGTHAATAPAEALAENIGNGHSRDPWRRSTAAVHAQVIALLQRRPVTRADLAAEIKTTPQTIRRFMDELLDMGVVYVAARIRVGKTRHTEVLALNPTPFQNADAPRR
jgi:hypothetical protein